MTDEPVTAIRNLGPRTAEMFARAGIYTAAKVRGLGADEAYRRLLGAGARPHFIGYYAMVMGLQGRPWNDFDTAEKARLRERFDGLVAEVRGDGRSALESELDRLGVVARRPET